MKQLVSFYHMTFSDIEMIIEDIVAEGDMVVVRWCTRARHTGGLFGIEPTGREVETSGVDMLRIQDDKVVEGWVNWDVLSLLEQVVAKEECTGEADPMADFLNLVARLQRDTRG
jgi:predicted ester cyclase